MSVYIEIAMAGFVAGLGAVFAVWKIFFAYRSVFSAVDEVFRND